MVWVYLKITRTEKGKAFNLEAGKGIISLGKKRTLAYLFLSLCSTFVLLLLSSGRKEREEERISIFNIESYRWERARETERVRKGQNERVRREMGEKQEQKSCAPISAPTYKYKISLEPEGEKGNPLHGKILPLISTTRRYLPSQQLVIIRVRTAPTQRVNFISV